MTEDRGSKLIMVVEDNSLNLKLLTAVLTKNGYQVMTARDAEEAEVWIADRLPALILMDIQLPRMDGLELTRRLKADPRTRSIVILAITAYAMTGDRERALEAGCDGYLPKPIDTRTLPVIIDDYLSTAGSGDAP